MLSLSLPSPVSLFREIRTLFLCCGILSSSVVKHVALSAPIAVHTINYVIHVASDAAKLLQLKGALPRESTSDTAPQISLWSSSYSFDMTQVEVNFSFSVSDACQTLLKRHTHVQAWLFGVSLTHSHTHTRRQRRLWGFDLSV